jgi:hypothetical protein
MREEQIEIEKERQHFLKLFTDLFSNGKEENKRNVIEAIINTDY